jgi:Winged helix DNA-binding domain
VTAAETLRARLRAQRLEPRLAGSVADVVRAVCGVQAQDARAAALSVRARSVGLTARDVERARVDERSVVRTWAWRGTLHLLAAEDLGWVLPLVAPPAIRGVAARWRQLGLDERVYAAAREAMAEALADGPLTRAALVERLSARGIDAGGQRAPHLLGRAGLEGLVCQGPGEAYVLLEDWIGPLARQSREAALAELGRRYRDAYGPAGARDLAAWSGVPMADARAAWLEDERTPPPAGPPVVRLLPSFDTYLLGYRTRELAVAPEHARRVWPGGGWIHPTVVVDGRVVATWRFNGGQVEVEGFAGAAVPDTRSEAADVERFLEAS